MNIDFNCQEWRDIKEWAENRLAEMRIENDSPHLDKSETDTLRGRIDFAKDLIALDDKPDTEIPIGNNDYLED